MEADPLPPMDPTTDAPPVMASELSLSIRVGFASTFVVDDLI